MYISFRATRNLGLTILLAITVSVCIFSYRILRSATDKLSTIVTIQVPKSQKWDELLELISDSKDRLHDYELGRTDVIASAILPIDKAYKVAKSIKELAAPVEELENINAILEKIRTFRQAIFAYATEGYKGGTSAREMESMAVQTAIQIVFISRSAVEDIDNAIKADNNAIIAAANVSRKILAVAVTIAVILTVLVAFIMGIAISRPISKLVKAANKLATGDLSTKVDIRAKDEIGHLAYAFNKMTDDLQRTTTSIINLNKEIVARKAAEGKLRKAYIKLREMQKRLMHEVTLAKHIQDNLMPQVSPLIPGISLSSLYVPSREIGGDYYDFILQPNAPVSHDNLIYIAIGDVSGKGIDAGLVVSYVKATLDTLVMYNNSCKDILDILNRKLFTPLGQQKFVSLLLFKYMPQQNKLFYSAAGHEHILIKRSRKEEIEVIQSGGVILGMFDKIGEFLKESTLEINKEDKVLVYTDGAIEARNPKGESYGLSRLIESFQKYTRLSIKETIEKTYQDIKSFMSSQDQYDDITLVGIQKD